MTKIVIPRDHISLTSAHEIHEFCQPLFATHRIKFFDFARVYRDGNILELGSDAKIIKHYYESDYSLLPTLEIKYKKQFHFAGLNRSFQAAMHDFRENCQIDNLMTMLTVHEDYIDVSGFASEVDDNEIIDFYYNNLALLENFTNNFKEHVVARIKPISAHMLFRLECKEDVTTKIAAVTERQEQGLSNQGVQVQSNIMQFGFTDRELDCLAHLRYGRSAKSIARHVGLSHRTVEEYIARIKAKIGVTTKAELIDFLNADN